MTLFLSEAEMLDRYVDGLKKSASRAGEFLTAGEGKRLELFKDFIDGIKVAAGSAHQLAHSQMNPKWLDTRDLLENVITLSYGVINFTQEEAGPLWVRIQESLNQMVDSGRKLAFSKAMKWEDITAHLDHRAKNAELLSKSDV